MPAIRNTLQPVPDKRDAFCCCLSRDDDNKGDSNSIQPQENICQGGFHPKDEIPLQTGSLLFKYFLEIRKGSD